MNDREAWVRFAAGLASAINGVDNVETLPIYAGACARFADAMLKELKSRRLRNGRQRIEIDNGELPVHVKIDKGALVEVFGAVDTTP